MTEQKLYDQTRNQKSATAESSQNAESTPTAGGLEHFIFIFASPFEGHRAVANFNQALYQAQRSKVGGYQDISTTFVATQSTIVGDGRVVLVCAHEAPDNSTLILRHFGTPAKRFTL